MTVAVFLQSNYYYNLLENVADTQDILTALPAILAANSPAWTNNGGDSYTSPVDAQGRFFRVDFTRIDVNYLQLVLKDQNDTTVMTRRMYINNAATDKSRVQIFSGQFHLFIDATRGSVASGEGLSAGILDNTPEVQGTGARYVYGGGTRNSSNTFGNATWNWASMLANVTPTHEDRVNVKDNGGNNGGFYQTIGGLLMYHPREMFVSTATVTRAFAGRGYQQILVPDFLALKQNQIKVPIDSGLLGSFRGVAHVYTNDGMSLAVRVPA